MLIEKVIENLKTIKNQDESNIYDEIVCAFGDYEFQGVTEVIVSSSDCLNGFSPSEGVHIAYINHEDSSIIRISLEEVENGIFSVLDAWED